MASGSLSYWDVRENGTQRGYDGFIYSTERKVPL